MDLTVNQWADLLQRTALQTWELAGELPSVYANVWREDEPILTFMCPSRDTALTAVHMAAIGMMADRVSITFEGWTSTSPINPDTGAEWKEGELNEYVENHGETEMVGTVVFTHVVAKTGESASSAHRVYQSGDQWLFEELMDSNSGKPEGMVADWMTTSMMESSIAELLTDHGFSIEEADDLLGGHERRMLYQDQSVIENLIRAEALQGLIFTAKEGTERNKLLEEKFGNGGEFTYLTAKDFLDKFS